MSIWKCGLHISRRHKCRNALPSPMLRNDKPLRHTSQCSHSTISTCNTLEKKPLSDILLASFIFKLSSYKVISYNLTRLVDIPIVGYPIRKAFQYTAFKHFCGGQTVDECFQLVRDLYQTYRIHTIIDHSVEENDSAEAWQTNIQHKLKLLDISAKCQPMIHSIPIKSTSLMSSKMLEDMTMIISSNIHSTDGEIIDSLEPHVRQEFETGLSNLQKICERASTNKIKLLLDAEQSYRQPAVNLIARVLSKEFNRKGKEPTLFNTYQMYLKTSKYNIERDLNAAKEHGYTFAGKIVRGAYMVSERQRANELRLDDPILSTKDEVDKTYDEAVEKIISEIGDNNNTPCVIIATHNKQSILSAIKCIDRVKLDHSTNSIMFAQIMGMCDHLTIGLADSGFKVAKLVCFGSFEEILPWLIRRFHENQDVFGAMQQERSIYLQEILRRLNL